MNGAAASTIAELAKELRVLRSSLLQTTAASYRISSYRISDGGEHFRHSCLVTGKVGDGQDDPVAS